jgi:hypothetical protein
MSERERWIVYPLLMFALGAAIRDKLMDRVEAKEIRCESLEIVDQQDPGRILARLGIRRASNTDPTQLAARVGELVLVDNEGRVACDIATDVHVHAGRVITPQLRIIDPNYRPLIVATTVPIPALSLGQGEAGISYQGVIYLNNQGYGVQQTPPSGRPPTNQPQPPAATPAADPPNAE